MAVYFLLAIYLYLIRNSKNKFTLLFTFILLVCISGLRAYTVGTDTMNYLDLYDGTAALPNNPGEIALATLYKYLSSRNISYRCILFIQSILFFTPLFWVSYKRNINPLLSILVLYVLGYCFMSFNIIRQMIAAAYGIWAMYYIELDEKKWKPVLLIIFASLFHITSVVLFFAFFIKLLKINRQTASILLAITFVLPFLINFAGILTAVIQPIPLINRFLNYLDASNKSMFSFNRLLMNGYFIYLMYSKRGCCNNLYFKNMLFGLIIMNLMPQSSYVSRIAIFFTMSQIMFFHDYYITSSSQNRYILTIYFIAVLCSFIFSNNGGFVPYSVGI